MSKKNKLDKKREEAKESNSFKSMWITSENKVSPEVAVEFLNTLRGKYIVGQALQLAVQHLEKVEEPYKEVSNISDMRFLGENLFQIGWLLTEVNMNGFEEELGIKPSNFSSVKEELKIKLTYPEFVKKYYSLKNK